MSNPADSLHTILTRSREKEVQTLTMPQGWRNVLKLPEDTDDLIVMNKVGKVFTLPFIISTHIQRFADIPTDLYLGWRKDLAVAFRFVNFNSTFHEFGSRLSDSLLINIRFCAHELEKRMPEKNVSPEDLKTIRELAWELYQAVLGFELPPQIGRYLLSHLYLIIEAIDDYDITGAAGMERSFNAVIGAVVTDTPTSKEANESTFGDRFWGIVTKVGVVLKIAKTATELAEGVQKLLPNGK